MFDVIIIGSGPAGMTAAIVAARKKIKTLVLSKEFESDRLEKSSDFSMITTSEISLKFQESLNSSKEYLELKLNTEVIAIEKNIVSFSVTTKDDHIYYSKSVIIAAGSNSANDFDHLTDKDDFGKIKVTASMETSILGIFAAGGTINASEEQVLIAAGEGAKAAMTASDYLNRVRL